MAQPVIRKAAPQLKITKWFNPTKYMQRFRYVQDGAVYEQEIPPGETVEMSSVHDDHIQRVVCNDDECRKGHYRFCLKGHDGQVVGGVAPMLQRVGAKTVVADGIDPEAAKKKTAMAELAKARLAKQAIDESIALSAATAVGVDLKQAEEDASDDVAAPAKPAPERKPRGGNNG